MKSNNISRENGEVHSFLQPLMVKFRPSNAPTTESRLKDKKPTTQQKDNSKIEDKKKEEKLLFLQKISPELFAIGNQKQIDLIFVGSNTKYNADVQSIWSFNIQRPIELITFDTKKKLIAVMSKKELLIYKFDTVKGSSPNYFKSIGVDGNLKFIQFAKENHLACFYDDRVMIYLINEDGYRIKCDYKYQLKEQFTLIQVPAAYEGIVNIFFTEKVQKSKTISLWHIAMNISSSDIKFEPPTHIYKILPHIKIQSFDNYSQEIFLMNLSGSEIYAVKKGYIIDNINVNLKQFNSTLRYLPNQRMVHINDKVMEVYHFSIDKNSKPHKINLRPMDSIRVNKPTNSKLFSIQETVNGNFIVFYQLLPKENYRAGQSIYWVVLTHQVKLEEKMEGLFPTAQMKIKNKKGLEMLSQRVDMAQKMGLTIKQIYLDLWNRTDRKDEEDYQILLATKNYETIKSQVQRKLKKSSMKLRQILKIQKSCFEVLKSSVSGTMCTESILKQYMSSHFLIRKLQLFKQISLYHQTEAGNQNQVVMMSIQQYNKYDQCDIRVLLLDWINQLCFLKTNEKQNITYIRLIVKAFKFSFIVNYQSILQKIISTTKDELVIILKSVPQLLPYKSQDGSTLTEGIWSDITRQEWKQSLSFDNVMTIDNRSILQQLLNSIWFKRNQFFKHDFTNKKKEQIVAIHQYLKSQKIFYVFIANFFEVIKDKAKLSELVEFIQTNYQLLPSNIKGRIFLYHELYKFLEKSILLPQKYTKFSEFLCLKDYELFQHFFVQERNQKGLILKHIKPLYEQIGQSSIGINGQTIFNEGLLNYFASNLSEVSDLKYILNRINNEKKQFHDANSSMYAVLVQAILKKLTVGTDNDIPIDQVLVYIEGIPLEKQNAMGDVLFIEEIRSKADKFNIMKINMSLQQIKNNSDQVTHKMVTHQIQAEQVFFSLDNWSQFLNKSYKVLATVQMQIDSLYNTPNHYLPYFAYLCKILEEKERIPLAIRLLSDQHLKNDFNITDQTIESLVDFMYRWKFDKCPYYIQNLDYITDLLSILPEENLFRKYLQYEGKLQILLSIQEKVEHPLKQDSDTPTIFEISEIINQMSAEFVLQLNLQQIYDIVSNMEKIKYGQFDFGFQTGEQFEICSVEKLISLFQLYEAVLLRLYDLGKYRDSLSILKKLLNLEVSDKRCNIVYILVFIINISNEVNVQCLKQLLKCINFYFLEPLKLFDIVENIVIKNYSNLQRKKYLQQKFKEGKAISNGYSLSNFLFSSPVLEIINNTNNALIHDFFSIIENVNQHLASNKEQFQKNILYKIIFKILCCEPYALPKLFEIKKASNWRFIRSFLSFVIKEGMFSPKNVLEFARRVFMIIIESEVYKIPIQYVIMKFASKSLNDEVPDFQKEVLESVDKKLYKNVEAFKKKKIQLQKEEKQRAEKEEKPQKSNLDVIQELASDHGMSRQPSQYPFQDSDNQAENQQFIKDEVKIKKKDKKKPKFDPMAEMNKISTKKQKFGNASTSGFANITASVRLPHQKNQKANLSGSTNLDLKFKSTKLNPPKLQKEAEEIQLIEEGSPIVQQNQRKLKITKSSSPMRIPPNLTEDIVREQEHEGDDKNVKIIYKNLQIQRNQKETLTGSWGDKFLKIDNSLNQRARSEQFGSSYGSNEHNYERQESEDRMRNSIPDERNMFIQKSQSQIIEGVEDESPLIKQTEEKLYNDNLDYFTQPPSSKIQPNFSALETIKNEQNYIELIKKILKLLYYNHEKSLFSKLISFITQINNIEPSLGVKAKWIQIYLRAEDLHEKYNLDLPIKNVFPIQGLYFQGTTPQQLFHEIKPHIIKLLNEMNVYKMLKVISLAFRNAKLQQDLIFNYLKSMMRNHMQSFNDSDNKETEMAYQKISVFVQKMKPQVLQQRIEQLFQDSLNLGDKNNRKSLIQIVANSVRRRANSLAGKLIDEKVKILMEQ